MDNQIYEQKTIMKIIMEKMYTFHQRKKKKSLNLHFRLNQPAIKDVLSPLSSHI